VANQDRAELDARITAWLADGALSGRRIEQAWTLSGGYRNHNVLLVTDTAEKYVLRRFLHGNTCAIEAALADRLMGVAPVAEVIAADPHGAMAGQPVMLSRFMPGVLLCEALRTASGEEAHQLGHAVGAALAAIGTVTFPQPGFFSDPDLTAGPDGMEPTAELPAFIERCLRTGNTHHALTPAEHDALLRHADRCAPLLATVCGARQLVHSDFNPKNLLTTRRNGKWAITAVLDWEFAFASSPLFDVGNMLRFGHEYPSTFAAGFTAGFGDAGGCLHRDWRRISQALDLFALGDFLTRPPDNPFFGKAVALIRQQLQPTSGRETPSA
jgi:fructokinase